MIVGRVTSKTCTKCGKHLPLSEYHRRIGSKDGRRSDCRTCVADYKREHHKTVRSCPSCRRVLAVDEPDGRCSGCEGVIAGKALKAELPARLGRPGCVVYKDTALVPVALGEDDGRWLVMSVKHCKVCGVDQHLETCLDCTAPVGGGDKQKSIRPLEPCTECGDYTPGGGKCRHCT